MTVAFRRYLLIGLLMAPGAWAQLATHKPQIAASGTTRELVPGPRKATKPSVRPLGQSGPTITLLGTVQTASEAESFAISGNLAYTCDNNEISVINIANPVALAVVSTATASLIQNSGDIHCDVQQGNLAVFSDQTSTTNGDSPGFVAFSLANPTQPVELAATPINRRFFSSPLYIGNLAFVPTNAVTYDITGWDDQLGDLLAIDVTNLASPQLLGNLEPSADPQGILGGANSVFGVTQANGSLLYLGYSTSIGNNNNGSGALVTVDASNPAAMRITGQLTIPGTVQSSAPLIQGSIGVSMGNNGGYTGGAPPVVFGNIVITIFDVSNPRVPAIISITPTSYSVGPGGGSAQIGNNVYAFAGVQDSSGNDVLLTVDVTNPLVPVINSLPLAQPFTNMRVVGTILYATLGSAGFAAYSIPGVSGATSTCSTYIDAMLVVDQGAVIPASGFLDAKTSLKSFVGTLQATDQVGVESFTLAPEIEQTLTRNDSLALTALDTIVQSGPSYIGGGIAAASAELSSPRHNPSASRVIVIISDGVDAASPAPGATLAAAAAAKAAGVRIISIQYGTNSNGLMQSIASSSGDFYTVLTP
jgi:hypothetical protein